MRNFSLYVIGLFCWVASSANAQLGVSPSQSVGLLHELLEMDGEAPMVDPLGDDRRFLEQSRSLTTPSVFSNSLAGASRLRGDLTAYSSQFQAGRSYLSPWSCTVLKPEFLTKGPQSAFGLALDQAFIWNQIDTGTERRDAAFSTSTLSVSATYGTLETGRLRLNAAGGVMLAGNNEFTLSSKHGGYTWFMLPGSSLVYDIQLGDVLVSIYDRYSTRPDALLNTRGVFTNFAITPFFAASQNDLGAVVSWAVRPDVTITLDYNWAASEAARMSDARTWSGLNMLPDRDVHSVLAALVWESGTASLLGVHAGYSWSSYQEKFNANGEQWHAGLFAEASLPFDHRLLLDVGIQSMSFEPLPYGLKVNFMSPTPDQKILGTGDNVDLSVTPYFSLTLSGRLSKKLAHELSAGHEASLALVSNYLEADFVNYGIQAGLWAGASLALSGFYEQVDDSSGAFAGDTSVYGGVARLQQKLGRLTLSADYGCTCLDTGSQPQAFAASSASLDQQAAGVSLCCEISPRASLSLGWQRLVTKLDGAADHAEQNKITLGMRLVF